MSDAIQDMLKLMANLPAGHCVRQLVADIVDALWVIPNHPKQRKHFVAKSGNTFILFLRTAQGSRNAGVTFGTSIALVGRCIASLFQGEHGEAEGESLDMLMQIYVDDPWCAARGPPPAVDTTFAMIALLWMILGMPLALHKAHRGTTLTWTGVQLTVDTDAKTVVAEIPEDKIHELLRLVAQILGDNVIGLKILRTFTGNIESVASLLYAARPFIQPLWAALYADHHKAPMGRAWVKPISHALSWIQTFLQEEGPGPLTRTFTLAAYLGQGRTIRITTDASPWGIGGYLTIDGEIQSFFADKISAEDCEILEVASGTADGQQ